ncbi:copper chaperone [Sulfurivirga caldicuralii]|uniref:Copper chaperone n=1 Tax=Sulfurivirga caldicuralii TaxID=364032 RepID=A0A1N6GK50_9GAMM|nr:heavy metal-associated domain-containing protein [Sulfurivirga caldicuralii]SIO07861.1 copper chaperone [Sulfurivirga caldicuralii]
MAYSIEVENIKCGGCANSIRKRLLAIDGVADVSVDIEAGTVTVEAPESAREMIVAIMAQLGYPQRGSVAGLKAAGAKAKSFVSCAAGRIRDEDKQDS